MEDLFPELAKINGIGHSSIVEKTEDHSKPHESRLEDRRNFHPVLTSEKNP